MKRKNRTDPGPGYRLLERGEKMRESDQILKRGVWISLSCALAMRFTRTALGRNVGASTSPIRRKVVAS